MDRVVYSNGAKLCSLSAFRRLTLIKSATCIQTMHIPIIYSFIDLAQLGLIFRGMYATIIHDLTLHTG